MSQDHHTCNLKICYLTQPTIRMRCLIPLPNNNNNANFYIHFTQFRSTSLSQTIPLTISAQLHLTFTPNVPSIPFDSFSHTTSIHPPQPLRSHLNKHIHRSKHDVVNDNRLLTEHEQLFKTRWKEV